MKERGKCTEISSDASLEEVYEQSKGLFKSPILLDHPNLFFVLGGPGSGKGTQCNYIVQEFGFKHISTGDLLRSEIQQQSAIGRLAENYMNQGQMVPSVLQFHLGHYSCIAEGGNSQIISFPWNFGRWVPSGHGPSTGIQKNDRFSAKDNLL
jgi:hypothetical protein